MFEKLMNKKFLILLAIINFAVGIYSISYYFWQLEKTSPLLWIFIIDCPLYALIFGLNIYLVSRNKKYPLLGLLSIIGSLKYGLWTIFALLLPGLIFFFPLLVIGHSLLIIELILLYKLYIFKIKHIIPVLAWFLFNDFLDYFAMIHPYFEKEFFNEIMIFSFAITIILAFLVPLIFSKK